jgi:hypothetical protein
MSDFSEIQHMAIFATDYEFARDKRNCGLSSALRSTIPTQASALGGKRLPAIKPPREIVLAGPSLPTQSGRRHYFLLLAKKPRAGRESYLRT